jgi:hypothetical protein
LATAEAKAASDCCGGCCCCRDAAAGCCWLCAAAFTWCAWLSFAVAVAVAAMALHTVAASWVCGMGLYHTPVPDTPSQALVGGAPSGCTCLLKTARAFSFCKEQEMRWAILRDTAAAFSWPVACALFAIQSTTLRRAGLHPPPCASRINGVNLNPCSVQTWSVCLCSRLKPS